MMSIYIVPMADASELGAFYFTVELEGKDYQLNFVYNERDGYWYFDLLDAATGERLRSGVRVVVNFPFLFRIASLDKPSGELMFVDGRANPEDPGLEEVGVEALLAYIEEDQLP